MTDQDTEFGFKWGPALVQRLTIFRSGEKSEARIIQIKTDAGREIEVYVSKTGRSLRVWRDGKELK